MQPSDLGMYGNRQASRNEYPSLNENYNSNNSQTQNLSQLRYFDQQARTNVINNHN